MIIYFTGTGNSEYVAKMLADNLGDEVFFANQSIKEHKKENFTSEKPYIFVFPVYLSTSPTISRQNRHGAPWGTVTSQVRLRPCHWPFLLSS